MRHLWLIFCFLLAACSHSLQPSAPVPQRATMEPDSALYDQVVVVGTNDFHGYLRTNAVSVAGETVLSGGAEWFAGYVRVMEKKFGDRLVLLDGGDMFQGTIDSNQFLGKPVVEFYNLLPYKAVAVGNHEFDYGPEKKGDKDLLGALKARMREAKYPFVQANIIDRRTGKLWREKNLHPSLLVKAGPYKLGIIGLTTTSTPGKTLPKNVVNLEFREFVEPLQQEAAKLRKQGAELVIVTMHEGQGKKGDPLYEMLHAIPKGTVDAVVAGHTHTEVHEFVNGVPVIESKTRGLFFGRIDLYVHKQTRKVEPSLTRIHEMQPICGTWFQGSNTCDQKAANDALAAGKAKPSDYLPLRTPTYEGEVVKFDPKVRKVLAPYFAKADAKRSQLLGQAKRDFEWYPSGENEMGTLILDSFRARFPEAKAILMNGGGIRRRIFRGPITYGDLYEVSPFDNYAVLVNVSGKEFKEMLRVFTSGSHVTPAVWGVKVKYFNREDEKFNRDVNGDGKSEKWEKDRLVPETGVVWETTGKPVGDDERFWLATIDYLAAGGDNLEHIFKNIPESRRKYFQQGPRDLMAEYLKKNPGIVLPRTDKERVQGISGVGADEPFHQ